MLARLRPIEETQGNRMLRKLKRAALRASEWVGLFPQVQAGRWRRQRLLILAYHGISLDDEHEWDPFLYMRPETFRQRMVALQRGGYHVLSLDTALSLLREDNLPPGAVVITFDDGFHDFYARACPILQEFEYPATVYLTTYYCNYNKPVFNVFCSYLLWRGRGRIVDGNDILGREGLLDLRSPAGRAAVLTAIHHFVGNNGFSAEEKDELAKRLAEQVGVDYDAITSQRIVHLMTPDEIRRLSPAKVDIQLHTHRHRTPSDRASFLREITDNRECIRKMTGSASTLSHFCYPSGVHKPEFLPWLEEAGVTSATTCTAGMASRRSHKLLLPRFLDSNDVDPIVFQAWLAGVAAFLPRRGQRPPM